MSRVRQSLPKYAAVGLANTIIYYLLLLFFLKSDFFERPLSILFSFIIAMCFQFAANKFYTFRSKNKSFAEFFRYLSAAGVNYLASVAIVDFSIYFTGSVILASALAAFFTAFTGYLMSLLWIYKDE